MTKQNRNTRSLGPAGAAAFLLLLAASSALAISAVDGKPDPDQRRRAMRKSQIGVMDIFARNYGGADWSLVMSDLEAHPADPANPAFMSVPLSLANVYLNRYEVGGNKANLERSLADLRVGRGEPRALGRPRRDRLGRQLPRHRPCAVSGRSATSEGSSPGSTSCGRRR